jgi:hypothetical protein
MTTQSIGLRTVFLAGILLWVAAFVGAGVFAVFWLSTHRSASQVVLGVVLVSLLLGPFLTRSVRAALRWVLTRLGGSERDWIAAAGLLSFLVFAACGVWFSALRSRGGWDSRPTNFERAVAGVSAVSGILAATAYARLKSTSLRGRA